MFRSRDILTTPQRHQQQARQAFRELALNVEESPRRRPPAPRPETPTPQPRYIERARTAGRASNRRLRDTDLLGSPRRRHLNPHQDENLQPVASTSRAVSRQPVASASRDMRDGVFMYNPLSSYDTPLNLPPIRMCSKPGESESGMKAQRRKIRLRQMLLRRLLAPLLLHYQIFIISTLPQANEVAVGCQNIRPLQDPQPCTASATNARSLGQQRRRAREREARSQRMAQGQEHVAPAHRQNNQAQQTPPATQAIQPAGQDDADEEARRFFNLHNAFADANRLFRRPGR
ncbi:hypothetical protein BDZ97DRAFT_1766213 [Flammula alnicola]|nr:hypothetical protein BDZ97DRAFT_1766213 [Flammula alnicola]